MLLKNRLSHPKARDYWLCLPGFKAEPLFLCADGVSCSTFLENDVRTGPGGPCGAPANLPIGVLYGLSCPSFAPRTPRPWPDSPDYGRRCSAGVSERGAANGL